MTATLDDRTGWRIRPKAPGSPLASLAPPVAAVWSVAYLGLGIAWLAGAGGNPADPAVDDVVGLSLLGVWGPRTGATIITALAGLGVALAGAMTALRSAQPPPRLPHHLTTMLAVGLGLTLAVVLPDYRLLAAIAYTPILGVLKLFDAAPEGASVWTWPVVNMAVLTLAGLAWIATALIDHRRHTGGCLTCGGVRRSATWTTPQAAARWGRWATGVAVVVPLGYAATRYAWALGIPLGVSQQLLDDLGNAVYAGAGLATLAMGGAILTLGLVQRWGEVFPRWLVGLRGRRVPVALAVVPAGVISVSVASAGLMFVRFGVTGQFGANFPGENRDVAAWLPEMFWPLWGAALAAATYAYWLRRRGRCHSCGQDPSQSDLERLERG
ncbi:hypothetical protein BH20ACT22_BH20ACT22_02080 [soil metagenome]